MIQKQGQSGLVAASIKSGLGICIHYVRVQTILLVAVSLCCAVVYYDRNQGYCCLAQLLRQ